MNLLTFDQNTHSIASHLSSMGWSIDRNIPIPTDVSKYDVIFIDYCDERAAAITKLVNEMAGPKPKIVIRIHAYEVHSRLIFKVFWNVVSDAIFVSGYYRNLFLNIMKPAIIAGVHLHVVPNVIDFNKFTLQAEPRDLHKVAVLSSISPKKGASLLGVVAASFPEFTFDVGGNFQDERTELYLKNLALPNLKFHGYVNNIEFTSGKKFLLSVSPLESFGMSIGESLALGMTPLILKFPGAENLWPSECLWSSFQELDKLLTCSTDKKTETIFNPEYCHNWVKNKYPMEESIQKLTTILTREIKMETPAETREKAKQHWKNAFFQPGGAVRNTNEYLAMTNSELLEKYKKLEEWREELYNWKKNMRLNDGSRWKNKTVLDFGCGSGVESFALSKHGPREIVVADIVNSNVEVASKCLSLVGQQNRTLLWGSIPELEQGLTKLETKFDIIYSAGVLHHIPDVKDAVKLLKNYLSDKGVFYLMLYFGDMGHLCNDTRFAGKTECYGVEGPYTRTYTKEDVLNLFDNEFEIVDSNLFYEDKYCLWVLKRKKEAVFSQNVYVPAACVPAVNFTPVEPVKEFKPDFISLAMIVKDEEKTLEQTVASARQFVDEIIIGVDTESTDGTRALAEKLADKVIDHYLTIEREKKESVDPGTKDWGFSAARNRVLSCCSGQWRLILDGHEELVVPEGTLKDYLKTIPNNDGVEVKIWFEPTEKGVPRLIYDQGRLLRDTVTYSNSTHNVPNMTRPVKNLSIKVIHKKHEQDPIARQKRDVQRDETNVADLKKKVEENPKDTRSWYYLGMTYRDRAMWAEAIPCYQKYLELGGWNEERWHARHDMARCLSNLNRLSEAREQLARALDEFPPMAEAYYELGMLAYKQSCFYESLLWFEKCCSMEIPNCRLFVNPEVYMYLRWDALAMTYHHLHRWQDAIDAATKALEKSPDTDRLQTNIDHWKKFLESQIVKPVEAPKSELRPETKSEQKEESLASTMEDLLK